MPLKQFTLFNTMALQKYLADSNVAGGPHGSHYVYWVPLSIFNELGIERWKHNRPPDADRVKEIHDFIRESKRVDGMMYLACINKKLVCYESNHRREALVGIDDVAPILVDIIWDASDDQVKDEFLRLNKAVSVPDLYVSDDSAVNVDDLCKLVSEFCNTYRALKVNTGRPQAPNFNQDMVFSEFYRVMKENRISANELAARILRLNAVMAGRDRKKLSTKVIEKCEKSGLWLFAWSRVLDAKELV